MLDSPNVSRHKRRNARTLSVEELKEGIRMQRDPGRHYGLPKVSRVTRGSQLHVAEKVLEHSKLINAIMISMTPKIYQICYKKFTKEIIKNYFREIREKHNQTVDKHLSTHERELSVATC